MHADLWTLILCHLKLRDQAIYRRIEASARDAIVPADDFILKRRFSDNAEHLQSFFAYLRRHVFVYAFNIVLEHIPLSLLYIPKTICFSSVQTLSLRLTRITDRGVESLLRSCCNLAAFICVDNPLGVRACKAVARTAMTSSEIVAIRLSSCSLSDESLLMIAWGCKNARPDFYDLDVSHNAMNLSTFIHFCAAFRDNQAISFCCVSPTTVIASPRGSRSCFPGR